MIVDVWIVLSVVVKFEDIMPCRMHATAHAPVLA